MGKMTFGKGGSDPYLKLKYDESREMAVGTSEFVSNSVVKPSFSVVEHSEIVLKPVFTIKEDQQTVIKHKFVVQEFEQRVEKPKFTIHESEIAVEKPNFVTFESHLGLKADWTLRILLGISILANIWHTLR